MMPMHVTPRATSTPADPSRWPWRIAAVLLLGSAVATAWSLVLHWSPCRGALLSGTALERLGSNQLTDACLQRMDGALPFPYPPEPVEQAAGATELGVVAMVLCGLATLVLVAGRELSATVRRLLVLIAAPTLIMAGLSARAAGDPFRDPDSYPPEWLWVAGEVVAVLILIVLLSGPATRHRRDTVRTIILVWALTAFGLVHGVIDYVTMTAVSTNNWDLPPGTGIGIVLVLVAGAVAAFMRPRAIALPPDEPDRPAQTTPARSLGPCG